jgi:multidrug resistance efflux pump
MNKLTVGITAAVITGLLAFIIIEGNAIDRLENDLAAKRQNLAALQASLATEEAALASQEAKARELAAIKRADVDTRIRDLLGDEGLEYVQMYERTSSHRAPFREVESMLLSLGEPLSPELTDLLVAWAAAQGDPLSPSIPANVVKHAASLLTPLQLEKLQVIQASRSALPQLLATNLAAAAEGKLRLVPSSQREMTEWLAKTAKAAAPGNPSP